MSWFNYCGLCIMAIIMIPNVIFAVKRKGNLNGYKNRFVEIAEQIGRYACFALMIFNIPYTYFGFWFDYALAVYLSVNGALCFAYCVLWVLLWNSDGIAKALALSIIPTAVFLFSGIMLANIPLIVFSVVFGAAHVFLSYKNAVLA